MKRYTESPSYRHKPSFKSPKLNIEGSDLKLYLGEPGKDTCSGDGGSPLVCQAVSGRWHVVGLVSWGIGCGVAGRPAIYTNVFHYLDFIYEAKQNGNGDWIGNWNKFN